MNDKTETTIDIEKLDKDTMLICYRDWQVRSVEDVIFNCWWLDKCKEALKTDKYYTTERWWLSVDWIINIDTIMENLYEYMDENWYEEMSDQCQFDSNDINILDKKLNEVIWKWYEDLARWQTRNDVYKQLDVRVI